MVDEYFRNLEEDHIDYKEIQITSKIIDKLVHETNDQVEEFLMRERLYELKNIFPTFFAKIQENTKIRMYYETKELTMLDVIAEEEYPFRSLALFRDSIVMIPFKLSDDPGFSNFLFGR